jgi:NAD(P)-dependent dehydrogenase (short-subunit alcohol dehydrogenase family)
MDNFVCIFGGNGIIGIEVTKYFLNKGYKLIVVDKNIDNIPSNNSTILIHGDIFDRRIQNEIIKLIKKHQVTKFIVNIGGAGIPLDNYYKSFIDMTLDEWNSIININLNSAFICAQMAIKVSEELAKNFVFTSSMNSINSPRFDIYSDSEYKGKLMNSSAAYTAAKSGLNGLCKYLACYYGPKGYRFNCVLPGGVYSGQNKTFVDKYNKHIPLNRMANGEEIASTIEFLISVKSSYINGQLLSVDGGRSAW